MKLSGTRILAVSLAIALGAAVAIAQPMKHGHMHGPDMFGAHMLLHMSDELNLTDAQQSQLKDILAKEKSAAKPGFEALKQSHDQMMQLITSGSFDEAQARSIASQQAQTMVDMEVQHARSASQAFQVLTPDQRTKALQLLKEKEQRWMQHTPPPDSNPPDENQ
jgi:periplasmic protein CpxP/Spy